MPIRCSYSGSTPNLSATTEPWEAWEREFMSYQDASWKIRHFITMFSVYLLLKPDTSVISTWLLIICLGNTEQYYWIKKEVKSRQLGLWGVKLVTKVYLTINEVLEISNMSCYKDKLIVQLFTKRTNFITRRVNSKCQAASITRLFS